MENEILQSAGLEAEIPRLGPILQACDATTWKAVIETHDALIEKGMPVGSACALQDVALRHELGEDLADMLSRMDLLVEVRLPTQ